MFVRFAAWHCGHAGVGVGFWVQRLGAASFLLYKCTIRDSNGNSNTIILEIVIVI